MGGRSGGFSIDWLIRRIVFWRTVGAVILAASVAHGLFGNIEVVEPLIVGTDDDGKVVVDVGDEFAAVVAVKVANDDFIVIAMPNEKVVEPVDAGDWDVG